MLVLLQITSLNWIQNFNTKVITKPHEHEDDECN